MKLLLLSDTHIRSSASVGRIDDFRATQFNKWEQIFEIARKHNVTAILQAGDMWDKPNPSYDLFTEFVGLFKLNEDIKIYTVLGQHDMYMRSTDIKKTVSGAMREIGLVNITNTLLFNSSLVEICFAGWNEDIPNIKTLSNSIKILVIHKMIGDKPLYSGQDITLAENFLATYSDFDLILCGDYHYPFYFESKDGRKIVNTGCLLRLTRTERDMNRTPHVYIYDTETKEIEKHNLRVKPASEVFDLKEKIMELDVNFDEFIEKLKKSASVGMTYKDILKRYFIDNKTPTDIQAIIESALSETFK